MNIFSKVFIYSLVSTSFILLLPGCSDGPATNKGDAGSSSMKLMDEVTSITELPSVLQESLSPDEKADLLKKILPQSDSSLSPDEQFQKLREDATAGNAEAQNSLGTLFYSGHAISRDASGKILDYDLESAAAWFYRAAEQGHAAAQFNLGLMYVEGQSVPKDSAKAVELFTKSAEQGNVDAQNNLGVMYFVGEGVSRDVDKAKQWFEKAAAQGNAEAKGNLEALQNAGN